MQEAASLDEDDCLNGGGSALKGAGTTVTKNTAGEATLQNFAVPYKR